MPPARSSLDSHEPRIMLADNGCIYAPISRATEELPPMRSLPKFAVFAVAGQVVLRSMALALWWSRSSRQIESTAKLMSGLNRHGMDPQPHGIRRLSQRHHRNDHSDLDIRPRSALAVARPGVGAAHRRRLGTALRADGRTLGWTDAATSHHRDLWIADRGCATHTHRR
jgi:hypothetical protein